MTGRRRGADSSLRKRLRRAWVFVASAALVGLLVLLPVPYLLNVVLEVEGPYETWALWGLLACLVCILLFGLVHVAIEVYEAVRDVLRS
ncbi:hypothetical protein [Nocardiopsis ganjiahuensis]|uniref:hypothetical protein n=1 Tax=Nocardiopsis ganjiahuensis TaxID=239984 RepID=UPI0012697558|nr:hypothetical protein [Nocardiopsis ganjiahuensis]